MRKLFSTVAAFLPLGALMVRAQPPSAAPGDPPGGRGGGGGGRAGFVPKNLQVLNPATFPDSIRNMILMVRELNGRFPDGKEHATCYTCHRGGPTPAMAPAGN